MHQSQREERRSLLTARWRDLPAALRTDQQLAGRGGVACGATWGIMEKCNFACTSCYLTELGNETEPLPFAEAKAQLDTLRQQLGHGGKVQITSGEVTLLPVEDLGRIVRYALDLGLDPMVMTNGERFRQDESYLVRLVRDYGLRKVSLHIDTTQVGRRWSQRDDRARMPMGLGEPELAPLRDEFAAMIQRVRRATGARLHVAHTITVTPRTVDDVSAVTAWALRQRTFRLISFLPVATVGRTRDSGDDAMTMDAIWRRIETGAGRSLNRDAMHFGHRECNVTVPILLLGSTGDTAVEVVRGASRWDRRVFGRTLREVSEHVDLDDGALRNALRALLVAVRRPFFGIELFAWGIVRGVGVAAKTAGMLLRGRVPRPRLLLLVVHKFMNGDELATPLGQERLAGCVFKLPLPDGRLVSMCEMNATSLRHELNLARKIRR